MSVSILSRRLLITIFRHGTCRCMVTTSTEGSGSEDGLVATAKSEKISKAMKAYLLQAKKDEEFMAEKREEFELGKRHLANMMGWDPQQKVSQKDINEAIRYLLPSSLFTKEARPMMKPPEEIYPPRKNAQFDISGRPFDYLFYTAKPKYYEVLHQIEAKMKELNKHEDKMIRMGITNPPKEARVDLTGSRYKEYSVVKASFLERVSQADYNFLCESLDRLAAHPYSGSIQEFFKRFREDHVVLAAQLEVVPLKTGEDGRPFSEAEGLRKHCKAQVKVIGNGTGKVSINGDDLQYFDFVPHREQVMFPLQFTRLLFKVDFEATVVGIGPSAQAGAIRHGLSLALKSFVDPQMLEDMRLAGLLTKDRRVKERKKYGQEGARRKFTWKKR